MCKRERDLRIISAVKTSAGQEMALARAADRRERDALARARSVQSLPTLPARCVVLTVRDSAEHSPRWHFAVCL